MNALSAQFTNAQRAEVLTQALPYIREFTGKIIVVKLGGNAMVDESLKEQVMGDIVLLSLIGVKVVLVHGGGPEINDVMTRLDKPVTFVDGLRVTDRETVDIVQMVLAGKVNKTLVKLLEMKGGNAMGISGMDGRLIEARMRDERLGYVGDITAIHTQPILDLLEKGYIPVISSVGIDDEGNTYNINGDTAAAHIAGALQADRMYMMTDITGVLRDKDDPDTLISELTIDEAEALKREGVISGGMIPKVDCCITSINLGVESVTILDGRVPHAILMELLTEEGAGTMVRREHTARVAQAAGVAAQDAAEEAAASRTPSAGAAGLAAEAIPTAASPGAAATSAGTQPAQPAYAGAQAAGGTGDAAQPVPAEDVSADQTLSHHVIAVKGTGVPGKLVGAAGHILDELLAEELLAGTYKQQEDSHE